MATGQMSEILRHLRRAVLRREGAELTDGQLLEGYVCRGDRAALAALVEWHGPMVWGVCRRLLRNHHDAEDVFQATFLLLVRKAASSKVPASWKAPRAGPLRRSAVAGSLLSSPAGCRANDGSL